MEVDKRIFAGEGGAGLDQDTDPRFVGNGFYINGRNVNVMTNGNRFILTNMKGNTLKSYSLNAGANLCIGGFDDKGNETVYFFIWNATGDHLVLKYEYNFSIDAISVLAEGEGFNFKSNKLITGIDIVNDRFLVWAQEDEEVGCLDLENLPVGAITAANRWQIELAKVEDPAPLECFYVSDEQTDTNTLEDRSFQFRYRYVYEGNFRSPYSTISKVPVPDNIFLKGNINYKETYDNKISILVPQPSFNKVEKVELFVRYAQDDNSKDAQQWYKFKEVEYSKFSNLQPYLDIVFTGNEALELQDPTEVLAETAFFPKSVKEIVFLPSNVLAFLNFVEGNDTSLVDPEVELIPLYKTRPTSAGSPTTTATFNAVAVADIETLYNETYNTKIATIQYRAITIGGTPQPGDVIKLTLDLNYTEQSGLANPVGIPASPTVIGRTFEIAYVVKEEDTTAALIASKLRAAINAIDTRYDGFGGIVAFSSGGTVRIYEGDNENNSPYNVRTTVDTSATVISVTTNYPTLFPAVNYKLRRAKKTLKRNATHPFAIQYRDLKGRRSGAIPIGDLFVRGQDKTTNDDWVELQIIIDHLAPSWATHYDILYAKNQTFEEFVQIACHADMIETDLWRFRVYDQLKAFYEEYGNANDTLDSYNYNFAEGDRIRLLADVAGSGAANNFTVQEDYPILRDDTKGVYAKFDSSALVPSFNNGLVNAASGTSFTFYEDGKIIRQTGSWLTQGYAVGQFVTIKDATSAKNDLDVRITGITTVANPNDTLITTGEFTPVYDQGLAIGQVSGFTFGSNTIARASGSWITDGYAIGQMISIRNAAISVNNRTEVVVTNVTASTITTNTIFAPGADNQATIERTGDTEASFTRTEKVLVEVYTPAKQSVRPYYEIAVSGTVDSNGYHSGNGQNQNGSQPAVLNLYNVGDVYQVYIPFVENEDYVYTEAFIESMHMGLTKTSAVTDIGRSNVELEYNSQVLRDAAITFTQPIIDNSPTNGLSIVLPTSIYNEFGSDFGSIQKAFLRQDRVLIILFEDKIGQMGVFSELQKSPNGTIAYATDSLTNQINFYAYDGGIGKHPESFAYYDTVCYFLSPRNNAVCRLSNDGITEVSKYGMTTWFNDNLDVKSNNLTGLKAVGVYDERNTSYILSLSQNINLIYLGPAGGNSVLVRPDVEGAYGSTLIEAGDTLVITDTSLPANTYTRTVASVTYNPIGGTFTILWEEGTPLNNQIASMYVVSKIDTLMFNEVLNRWVSFLDFSADMMATCGIDFVSWNVGNTYLHNSNEVRGSYYGTLYPAEVTVPFNAFPGVQKRYQTIEQEATSPWISPTDGDVSIQDGNQKSQLFGNYYSQYQPNEYAAAFRQDTLTPNRVNPLLDGYDLRGKYMTLRLSNSSTTEEKLAAIAVTFFPSESSL